MAIDNKLAVILRSNGIGEGEPDLGAKLLNGFLDTLFASGRLPRRMIFLNSGIFLTTDGSPVADISRRYEDEGTEILSCSTCLQYYGRADKLILGEPTTMKETVETYLEMTVVAP